LHFRDAVDHGVPCGFGLWLYSLLFALAKVGTTDELTYDDEVCTLCHFGTERRVVEEGV
jgi:hypothetical protein